MQRKVQANRIYKYTNIFLYNDKKMHTAYRILPILTDSYRIVPILTAFYRLTPSKPFWMGYGWDMNGIWMG